MEAGTGIEPVFTDLQSRPFQSPINGLGSETYQDKRCTTREPDTAPEGPEKENPGAQGSATGARECEKNFRSERYRLRAERSTTLCMAIAECDRDDAVMLMEAALWDLRAGAPGPVFLSIMQEAEDWADWATVSERKAYCLASFNRLSAPDRAAFLAHVTGGGHG